MADCLQLSNGNFVPLNWSTASSFNADGVTITRNAPSATSAGSISIQRAGQTGSIDLSGDFRYIVFGDDHCIAFMRSQEDVPGNFSRAVSLVDITTPNIQSVPLFTTSSLPVAELPQIAHSPGNGRLVFTRAATGVMNEVQDLTIWRSDDGALVMSGPTVVSNLNGPIDASVTATQLIISHPRDFGSNRTVGPRPEGSLLVVEGAIDFGEAVLNADDPGLATITRTFTLRNNRNDCLTISAIGDSAPFSVAPGVALPATLGPDAELSVPVVFAPTSTDNNITRLLPVTRSPANGAATLECRGGAREAEARITVNPGALAFGVVPAPASPTRTYAIANTGERTVTIAIPAPPPGSPLTGRRWPALRRWRPAPPAPKASPTP
jgi:hypothetical protein